MNVLGDKVWKKDWAVGCDEECRAIEGRGNLPQTRLLVSQSGVTRPCVSTSTCRWSSRRLTP